MPLIFYSCLIVLTRYFSVPWGFFFFLNHSAGKLGFLLLSFAVDFSSCLFILSQTVGRQRERKKHWDFGSILSEPWLHCSEGKFPLPFQLLGAPISEHATVAWRLLYRLWWDGEEEEEKDEVLLYSLNIRLSFSCSLSRNQRIVPGASLPMSRILVLGVQARAFQKNNSDKKSAFTVSFVVFQIPVFAPTQPAIYVSKFSNSYPCHLSRFCSYIQWQRQV